MKTKSIASTFLFGAAALSITCVALPLAAQTLITGVNAPDPARWTQEDVTRAQKLSTAQKEATNAPVGHPNSPTPGHLKFPHLTGA